MGSEVSPILSQYIMDNLLSSYVLKHDFNLHFFKKYVDDIITSVPQGKENQILDVFNSYNPHIKFTIEKKNNNSVPFLHTRIIRTSSHTVLFWILDWYQKNREIYDFSFISKLQN